MRTSLLAVAACLALAGCTAATGQEGGREPRETMDTMRLRPGATLTVADDRGVVNVTLVRVVMRDRPCDELHPAPANGQYLDLEVTATVVDGEGGLNPLSFVLILDGREADRGNSGCGPELETATDLPAGTSRNGSVSFDVSERRGRVEYVPGRLGAAPVGAWIIG